MVCRPRADRADPPGLGPARRRGGHAPQGRLPAKSPKRTGALRTGSSPGSTPGRRGPHPRQFNTAFFTPGTPANLSWPVSAGALWARSTPWWSPCALLPIGVAAAVYLEEFAPRNRWTDIIEVNINNLAAVPSIVFGLLGLAVFLNFFGLPRSAPLVGGLVLTLMTLPTIIIASRPRSNRCRPRSARRPWAWGRRRCRRSATMSCPWPCPGC